ncbi:MAG TPA: glycosyltransferase [Euzebya sp.]|nr:glycosyltransferase [Euzebya sp.]
MPPIARVGLIAVHTSPLAQAGTGDSGGLNVYVNNVARGLTRLGVAVDVFTRRPSDDVPATVHVQDGLQVHHVDAGPPTLRKSDLASHLCAFYLGLAAHPAARHVEVFHGHYWMSGWVGARARRHLGIPLVQTFHTLARQKNATLAPGDVPESPLRLAAEARVTVAADAIIAPTPGESAMLRRTMGASQVHVVEPGVDMQTFNPAAGRAWTKDLLNPTDDAQIMLFVGRLQPLKGPDAAVRTLAHLKATAKPGAPALRLVIVGGPSGNGVGVVDPTALAALARSLGVGDDVAFLTPRAHEELAALYTAADVVLMPSHSESFGLVALEAQACGTPVVATDVGGLSHVLGHLDGEAGGGTLVSDHDPAAFARAVRPILANPRLAREMGQRGLRRAQRFSWDATASKTLDVYEQVAGSGRLMAQGA